MKTNKSKLVSKFAAVGLAATMMGTTVMGGMAANLADLPAPFVANGTASVQFVIGQNAATNDLLGAVDIATALQAQNIVRRPIDVPGQGTDYSIDNGIEIAQSGDDLNFGEAFNLGSNLKFDDNDFPELLADGVVDDQDENDEWEYQQEIRFPSGSYPKVNFGIPSGSSDVDLPQLYVDFANNNDQAAYTFVVDFDERSDLATLEDSESIEMFGKVFTFDPDNSASGSEFTLFGANSVTFLELNVPQTITVEGETVEIEVVGANSEGDNSEVVLSINGQRETVEEGDSRTIGGIDVFVQDVFVTNIPTLDASATIFVGSDEYKLQKSVTFDDVELNGEQMDGVYFALNNISAFTANLNSTDDFSFQFRPGDLPNNEDEYLLVGESVMDPFLDIELTFAGPRPALNEDERSFVEVVRSGTDYELSFTNRDGERYEGLPILEEAADNSIRYTQDGGGENDRLVLAQTEAPFSNTLQENDFFFTYEGSTDNTITKVYSVDNINDENNVEYAEFKDLATGNVQRVEEGDTLGSTGLVIDKISTSGTETVNFTTDSLSNLVNYFVTEGDLKVTFGAVLNSTGGTASPTLYHNATGSSSVNITWTWQEDSSNRYRDESDIARSAWTTLFHGDSGDEDNELFASNLTGGVSGDEDYDDYDYYMTQYGTYIVWETENDGDSYKVWYPTDGEADYVVFLSPTGAQVTVGGSSGGQIFQDQIVPINVGAAVLDVDVDLADVNTNLIVMGGPRANSISNELLEMPSDEDINAMFMPGEAVVKMFDLDNGKVAMLVAGYEARETQAASRMVARFDPALTGQEVTLTVTNLNSVRVKSSQ